MVLQPNGTSTNYLLFYFSERKCMLQIPAPRARFAFGGSFYHGLRNRFVNKLHSRIVALCKTIVSAIVSVFDGLAVWQLGGLTLWAVWGLDRSVVD